MKTIVEAVSFRDLEQDCEYRFMNNAPFWHLYTDGTRNDIIFSSTEDFKAGMNIMGVCCLRSPYVKVLTFELMNNHLHIIMSGEKDRCMELFSMFKQLLRRYFTRNGKVVNLRDFECQMIEITTLQSLRNEIIYVNRNGYVARPDCTPYSYPWGAGASYFNPFLCHLSSRPYNSLTVREKRRICHSNDTFIPTDNARVFMDVIMPSSYCQITEGESLFRSAHQYFNYLSRKFEAYSEIANRLHESLFISDEEMYSAVCSLCMKSYNVKNPTQLSARERIETARKMRQLYNASNRQIKNILKLESTIVDEMFPKDV